MNKKEFSFSDELIGNLIKALQLSILTGTDILDHLRAMKVEPDDFGKLSLTETYEKVFEEYIEKLLEKAEVLTKEQEEVVREKSKNLN